jgi:hypothetical protein
VFTVPVVNPRDSAEQDRENAELKERYVTCVFRLKFDFVLPNSRVKSVEQGWETVLKALQTQGLPSSLFSNSAKGDGPSPRS